MRQSLDAWLNKLSMYRLITIILSGLAAMSVVLASFSLIAASPLEIITSAAVFLLAVGMTSWLVGYAFGVQAHGESSIITALILLFIFTPSFGTSTLAIYALIGMIAGASKFLLAWSGRHIFNPAAIAAVIIGFTTLAYASWWIATPWLFVPTLIGALVIMYKTNRLAMGLAFIGTASVLFVISQLLYGESLIDSLALIMSWPIVFFAGYMLTEPLTLPTKKWQTVAISLVLAIFIALPIEIGEFLIAPATALVAANLFSAIISRRRSIQLTYTGSRDLTPSSKELNFKISKPIGFEAGQYIELTHPHTKADGRGYRRTFSITSAPGATDLSIGIKFYQPSSTLKQSLQSMKKGTVLNATGINGSFTLPKQSNKKLLFIAGGIGITPFISHLRTLTVRNETRDIVIVYIVSSLSEVAYRDELIASGAKVYIVTGEKAAPTPNIHYIVSKQIALDQLVKEGVDMEGRTAYISGPPSFVRTVKKQLKTYGKLDIKTDYFTGY